MPVRAVEGKLPYTGGEAISIDENKVISLNLRDENNLIIYDSGDDEIYVDLQLPAGIKPNYAFPVGITTGRVLIADDWDVTGTILVAKTTSGDVIKLLYGDDGTLWMDNGTGLFKQIYFKSDVDAIITTLTTYINTELAKKQDKLIAGANINIASDGKTISAIDTTYTAGTGINISQNNEISNTLPGAVVSSTAPSNPSQGAMWYDTTTDTLMTYDGSQWNTTGGGGSGDVQVSTDAGNLLTTGVKLWLGDKADFDNLGTLDSNTIYAPAIIPWTPGANTLLYFPLESDAVDVVSSVTLTSYGITNYTTVGGVKSANFTKSNWLYNTSVSGLPSGDVAKTMSVWIYAHGTNTAWVGITSYGADAEEAGSGFGFGLKPSSIDLVMSRSWSTSNEYTLTQDQRTHAVMTYSSSVWTLYINGVSQVTWSETAPAYGSKVYIGQNVDGTSTGSSFYGNISNFILEDKARTATEVLNYFNKTKSNYGIS